VGYGPAFRGHDRTVVRLGFTPEGQHLLSGSLDGGFRVWGLAAYGR
jgi:hypothetical protein